LNVWTSTFRWYGDMLVPFALCGAVVFLARRLSPRWLLVLGGLAFATGSALSFALTWSTAQSDPVALAAWRAQWTPRPEVIALEIARRYRGGWAEQMAHRVPAALETQIGSFVTNLFWQMTGLMLIGMAPQAGHPQRRSFAGLLSAHGGPWVWRPHHFEIARVLAELRDEVGPP
jgi:uncharacterized membrane protein YeiB